MSEPTAEFFGIHDAAQRLGVSPSGVRRWERIGWIPPATRVAGSGRRLYRPSDIEEIRERVNAERAARQQRDRAPVAS
ncbi:MAG: MerR family transcriptional regulator [Chloroflexota bacterium]|nr:MerR family transcriptional regulator [Chloroflexota bacterium]